MDYPCIKCGLCCTKAKDFIDVVGEHPEGHILHFPYGFKEDGSCEMLNQENMCSVYDKRPTICQIDKMIELTGQDKAKAYNHNIAICNQMMDDNNYDPSKRISPL